MQDRFGSEGMMFPASPLPPESELILKDRVLGICSADSARAYPLPEFRGSSETVTVEDELDGLPFRLEYDPEPDTIRVLEAAEGLEYAYSLWFAWYAFYPETEVYEHANRSEPVESP